MPSLFNVDASCFSVNELLAGYSVILDELRRRQVVRSANNPLSDYAELLFCNAFQWKQERNSSCGYDACDVHGVRYQIKGRRLLAPNATRQLSAIRGLDDDPFDQLAGLLVDQRFQVLRAAIVPLAVVRAKATYVSRTNSWRFLLRDDIWAEPGVRDVTVKIQSIAANL